MSAGAWSSERSTGTTSVDVLADRGAAVGVAVLIVIGFVSSYTTVRDLAVRVGEFPSWLAPVVPLSFDVGIIVLSLRVLLAARDGRPARMLRTLVLMLSVATVLVNGVASDSTAGRLLHAVPSAMFVVCFETVVASARRRALGQDFAQADPRFRAMRWLLAPRATWGSWRTHVLRDDGALQGSEAEQLTHVAALMDRASRRVLSPAVSGAEATKRPGESVLRASRSTVEGAAPSRLRNLPSFGVSRDAAACQVVTRNPTITASALARELTDLGHPVSTRTAQRIRQVAREALTREGDGNESDEPPATEDA